MKVIDADRAAHVESLGLPAGPHAVINILDAIEGFFDEIGVPLTLEQRTALSGARDEAIAGVAA